MDDKDFFQYIQQDKLVLTANRRLSRACLRQYNQFQLEQDKQCWPTPNIFPLNTYLLECWRQTETSKQLQLLNEQQGLWIWQHVISKDAAHLSNIPVSAKLAQQAWQQCCLWNVDASRFEGILNEDQLAFQQWARSFIHYCEQHHFIDLARIHYHVIAAIQTQQLNLPKQVILHGFDQLNPRDQYFIDTLQQQGVGVDRFEFQTSNQNQQQLIFSDAEQQIQSMAKWAEQCARQGETVACVFPQLSSQRQTIERLFKQQLSNDFTYNISAGMSLIESPLVYAALQILELPKRKLDLEQFSQLLRSPYVGLAQTHVQLRAQLDDMLRSRGESVLTIDDIVDVLTKHEIDADLLQRLQNLKSLDTTGKRPLNEWLILFDQILTIIGWPGERALTSEEYQTSQRFLASFNEFISLEQIIKSCTYKSAVQHFKQFIQQASLQIQTQQSPIQILGLLEAAGLNFDRIWVADLDDHQWPAAASPHPFIPLKLQKQLSMPHSSAQRELQFSQQMMQRFNNSCQHLLVSYAKNQAAQTLQASPLIQAFPVIEIDAVLQYSLSQTQSQLFSSAKLVEQANDQAPVVGDQEDIHGGTFILKEQAACPFRAFAKFRLAAEAIEQAEIGLSGLERGLVLHNALEVIWNTLKTQASLLKQTDENLQQLIETTLTTILKRLSKQRKHTLTQAFIAIERQRLSKLLLRWLELEKTRPDFTVQAQEYKQEIQLAKLHLQMRVDRIDKTASGETLIIDYKTGKTSVFDWFDERPNEPQLPLYSLANDTIDGLLFAQLRPEELCFKGLTKQDVDIDGVNIIDTLNDEALADWPSLQAYWQQNLQKLAEDFCAGDATIDPKQGALTCQYCDLHSLCRINEEHV